MLDIFLFIFLFIINQYFSKIDLRQPDTRIFLTGDQKLKGVKQNVKTLKAAPGGQKGHR